MQSTTSQTSHRCDGKQNKLTLSQCQTILTQNLCPNVPDQCESTCNGCDSTTTTHAVTTTVIVFDNFENTVKQSTPSSTAITSTKPVTQTSSTASRSAVNGESVFVLTTTPVFYPSFVTFKSTSISKEECDSLTDAQKESIASAIGAQIQKQLSLSQSPAGFSSQDVTCGSILVSTPLDIGVAGKLMKILRGSSFWVPTSNFGELNFGMEIAGSTLELIDPSVSSEQCEQVLESSPSFAQDLLRTIATSVKRAISKNAQAFDIEREIVELGEVVCTSNLAVRLTVDQSIKQALENFIGDDKRIRGTAVNKQFSFVTVPKIESSPLTTVMSTPAGSTPASIPVTTNVGSAGNMVRLGGSNDGETNSITIAVVVCAAILLLAIIVAIFVGYFYVKRMNVGDPRITPRKRPPKVINFESNVEDGSYFNASSTLSRSQILPLSEKVGPENQYNSSKESDWRPGTHRSALNDDQAKEFPHGIPYSLRLKMSRRRRTNQRRNRRSRNRKPKVIPVDSRKTNSPSKLEPLQEINELSVLAPENHIPNLRVGPQSRLHNTGRQVQPSTFRIGPPSAKKSETRGAVRSIRVGPRSRLPRQNANLPVDSPVYEPSSARMDARDLDVRFASTPPVRIAVKPSEDTFGSPSSGFAV